MSGAAPSLYEEVLAAAAGRPLAPGRPPRDSAAVVLWRRDGAGELEVFWQRRGRTLPFMGGWHAFPGGAWERGDVALPLAGAPRDVTADERTPHEPPALDGTPASPATPDLAPGIVAAALRELWEETGVLLARAVAPGIGRALAGLAPGDGPLGERLATAGLVLDGVPFPRGARRVRGRGTPRVVTNPTRRWQSVLCADSPLFVRSLLAERETPPAALERIE